MKPDDNLDKVTGAMAIIAAYARLNEINEATDAELRLIGGELTAQEIRAVRAFVAYILSGNS